MKRLCLVGLLIVCCFLGSHAATSNTVYPYRWVRVGTGLRSDADVEKVRQIAETASKHGLNGILLSAGLDMLDLQPEAYHRHLKQVKEICDRLSLEIIPSFLSAGYGGAVLAHDKNLAAGLPVRDAVFVVHKGEARFQAEPIVRLRNGGFEENNNSGLAGYASMGKLGEVLNLDTQTVREGRQSLLMQNFEKYPENYGRITQVVTVQPYRCYRLSCWIKSEDLKPSDPFGSGNFQLSVLGGDEERPLQFENPKFAPTQDWHQVTVGFNSWGYHSVKIVPSLSGGGKGKFWIDDLQLEEVGLVNILRRPGTPLRVRNEQSGTLYVEGGDYARVEDPKLDFHLTHEGLPIRILSNDRIREGQRLRVSYHHGVFIYSDQVPLCMSEPKLYEIWRNQIRLVHQVLAPKAYFLNMDELRAGGSCEACKRRKLTMGQILGETLTRQYQMVKEVNPRAEVFVWSDMMDPNHNADSAQKWYYLAEGTYVNSWKFVPKDMRIVCWYFEKREASLKHFSSLGFKTMAGSYYDADDLENPRGWLEALDQTPGASGILYTTWLDKYDLLGAFGDLVSRRN
jgi:hypothetical protein